MSQILLIAAFIYFKMSGLKKISNGIGDTVISRTDIDLLLNDLSRPGSDAEAVTVKQRRVTHWHSESSWLSAPTNMFASFPLNVFVLQIVCMENVVVFLFFWNFCLAQVVITMEMDARFCLLWLYSPPRFDVETRHAFIGDQSGQVTILKLEQDSCSLVTTFKGHTGTRPC